MDVRSIVDVEPEVEHNGTVPVWYLIRPREMNAITRGGSLELVNEFEVAPGSAVYPHEHPTHEFYFVMSGRGVMTVADEDRPVGARRPRVHTARHDPQSPAHRWRRDPLLLLRGRNPGRGRHRLHDALRRDHETCRSSRSSRLGDRPRVLAVRLTRLGLRQDVRRCDRGRARAHGPRSRREPHRHRGGVRAWRVGNDRRPRARRPARRRVPRDQGDTDPAHRGPGRGARPPLRDAPGRGQHRPLPGALAQPGGADVGDDGRHAPPPDRGLGAPRRGQQLLGEALGARGGRARGVRCCRTRCSTACCTAARISTTCRTRRRTTGSSSPTARSRKACSAAATTRTTCRPDRPGATIRSASPRTWPAPTPLIQTLRRIASSHDATPAQVALAWLIAKPNVVAIPGASSVEQLRHNVAAADLDLADEELEELTGQSDAFEPLGIPQTAVAFARNRRAG